MCTDESMWSQRRVHCLSLCILWPCDCVHECVFSCASVCMYVPICVWVGAVCVRSCGSVCVRVPDSRHTRGDVFVCVFTRVFSKGEAQICVQGLLCTCTQHPLVDRRQKHPKQKQKKKKEKKNPNGIASNSRLTRGHRKGKVSRMDLERAERVRHPLRRGLCAGGSPRGGGPASQSGVKGLVLWYGGRITELGCGG